MSRTRVVAARLYAAFIHAQLLIVSCRSRLTKFLLLIPMMLSPKAVLTDGDLADMIHNIGRSAKTTQSSSLIIAQFIGVVLSLGGLIGLKKVGKQGRIGLASCIISIVIGAVLVAGPEMMSHNQKQLGVSSISVG